jgi:Domain of unknown function (DUF4350)
MTGGTAAPGQAPPGAAAGGGMAPGGMAPGGMAPGGIAPGGANPAAPGPGRPGIPGGTAGMPWSRWRGPVILTVVVLVGGLLVVLLKPVPSTTDYLDPGNTAGPGTRALASLLAQRGQRVVRVDSAAAAQEAAAGRAATVVVTSPYLLTPAGLGMLARMPARLLVVEPDSAMLSVLARDVPPRAGPGPPDYPPRSPAPRSAPGRAANGRAATRHPTNGRPANGRATATRHPTARPTATRHPTNGRPANGAGPVVTVAGAAPGGTAAPGCALSAAVAAGPARMGGVLLQARGAGVWHCYPVDGHPTLVRYTAGGRAITLLGSGDPLTNRYLARSGDAALALNLLRGPPEIVWLVPSPSALPTGGGRSLLQEIPGVAYLVALQLLIAAAVTAGWRARRLGPLVSEPLPVVIRAAETVEGHGRLYRSRHARGRAAAVLRAAARQRIAARLALPLGTSPEAACAIIAGRAGREPGEVRAILFGPDPRDDESLVALGADIDRLEGEVRTP